MKHLQQTFATYVYNQCNKCNILIYFGNIHLKQLQHTSETSKTLKTYACNMRFNTLQHLLAACEMEAHRHVEFTGGSHVIATINQMDFAYYKASGDPFVAVGIVGSTRSSRSPCSRRCSPHHHRISRCVVDLAEGATRQSEAEARSARCGRAATLPGGYAAWLGRCRADCALRTEVGALWAIVDSS
jgi:hypothetical protein